MLIPIELPRAVPAQNGRRPQANIPQSRLERENLKSFIARYVAENRAALTPPMPLDDLRAHADTVIDRTGIAPDYRDYAGVLLSNEAWREALAAVPYERRLLLLPKCLRVEDRCPAPFDELGLLCKQCGLCTIQDLQSEAERLGYAVLVAEGSALVMAIIQTGKIEAVVGVSCLSVLERAFPYIESAAIPSIAIPLLQDDCKDTTIDVEWVWDMIHLTSDDHTWRLDIDNLREEVKGWFSEESMNRLFGNAPANEAEQLARQWLAKDGKRWRPLLTACVYQALNDDPEAPLPDSLKRVALAVECFHKASLIHDDIEDEDDERYGAATMHAEYGVPVALNAGDLLVGEGYRLLAESGFPAETVLQMTRIAAGGHRELCLGQGAELSWSRRQRALKLQEVLGIFKLKTAPAFEVALRLGAACAGADEEVHGVLKRYSEALGIAYQIRDDIDDLAADAGLVSRIRPSMPLAEAFDRSKGVDRAFLEIVWAQTHVSREDATRVRQIFVAADVENRSGRLLESYKESAIRSLAGLHDPSLKGLLRRVIGKIFKVEIQGWCSEFEARNAASGQAVSEVAR
ncbi:MAG: polyprenyl synthetase family protein [Acidobacteria bacterium]|nr:polyprenyl synthetase family protein [Acidobacteriota bacterium]